MNTENYLITFHTHYDALVCIRQLKKTDEFKSKNLSVKMIPVPRAISSSCGSAAKVEVLNEHRENSNQVNNFKNLLNGIEYDSIYQTSDGDEYKKL